MLSKVPYERFQRRLIETLAHPVERRAEIIYELLPRILGSDVSGKSASFGNTGIGRLEPEQISIRSKLDGPFRGGWEASSVVVEAFASSRGVPGEEDGRFGALCCESTPP